MEGAEAVRYIQKVSERNKSSSNGKHAAEISAACFLNRKFMLFARGEIKQNGIAREEERREKRHGFSDPLDGPAPAADRTSGYVPFLLFSKDGKKFWHKKAAGPIPIQGPGVLHPAKHGTRQRKQNFLHPARDGCIPGRSTVKRLPVFPAMDGRIAVLPVPVPKTPCGVHPLEENMF